MDEKFPQIKDSLKWKHYITKYKPHLLDSYHQLVHITENLDTYLQGHPFLQKNLQLLKEKSEGISFAQKIVFALEYMTFEGNFETNTFLHENYMYVPIYTQAEYNELLADLQKNTISFLRNKML